MWLAFAQMAQQAAAGYGKAVVSNAANQATGDINDANTYAANLIANTNADDQNAERAASNNFAAAQASLSNLQRSVSNQNKLAAVGSQIDARTTNMARTLDSMNKGSIEQQITASATLGALRAGSASRGVGGTSSQILRNTMQQTVARQTQNTVEAKASTQYDAMIAQAGLMKGMVYSQDVGQSLANLDYGVSIATLTQSPLRAPITDPSNAALMGASADGLSAIGGGTVGNPSSGGGVGNTPGYSSGSILNGVNSIGDGGNFSSNAGSNGYGFSAPGGTTNGFFSTGGGNNSFNFQLS